MPAIARGTVHVMLAVKTYILGYLYEVGGRDLYLVCQGGEVEAMVIELKG